MRFDQCSDPGRGGWQDEADQQPIAREVAELTVRLRLEADRLAARYPPTASAGIVAKNPSGAPVARAALLTVIAVGILVAASVLPLVRPPSADRPEVTDRLVDAPGGNREARLLSPDAARSASAAASGLPVPFDPFAERPSPVFLMRVSDPELEAVLDLWAKDPAETTRLSI